MTKLVRTTIAISEMDDLLILLNKAACGHRFNKDFQRRAYELRESILAGTPEGQRVGR